MLEPLPFAPFLCHSENPPMTNEYLRLCLQLLHGGPADKLRTYWHEMEGRGGDQLISTCRPSQFTFGLRIILSEIHICTLPPFFFFFFASFNNLWLTRNCHDAFTAFAFGNVFWLIIFVTLSHLSPPPDYLGLLKCKCVRGSCFGLWTDCFFWEIHAL